MRRLERARRRDPDAEAAIADIERRGARSAVVKAIVRRLGDDLRRGMLSERPSAPAIPLRPMAD